MPSELSCGDYRSEIDVEEFVFGFECGENMNNIAHLKGTDFPDANID